MRGTWDDVNRRLLSSLLALDVDDAIVIGDAQEKPRKGWFSAKPAAPGPRRFAQLTATPTALVGEVVGSTSFGGPWPMTPETEAALLRQGWEKPWSEEYRNFVRDVPLIKAPQLALATVLALKTLGCEVETLDVELIREENSG